jgi:hypothetical protein
VEKWIEDTAQSLEGMGRGIERGRNKPSSRSNESSVERQRRVTYIPIACQWVLDMGHAEDLRKSAVCFCIGLVACLDLCIDEDERPVKIVNKRTASMHSGSFVFAFSSTVSLTSGW